jgi:pimeloyl-ACP methyl ester carboxylesterase
MLCHFSFRALWMFCSLSTPSSPMIATAETFTMGSPIIRANALSLVYHDTTFVKEYNSRVYNQARKSASGIVELAYEVTHPLEEESDTSGLIFVGGWRESGQTWRQQVAFFAPRFPTLTYDRRGLGRSSRPDHQDAYTVEQELADLGTLVMATGLAERPLWLIGHPFGGHLLVHGVLQEQASQHTRAKKLVLLAPTSRAIRDENRPVGAILTEKYCVPYNYG